MQDGIINIWIGNLRKYNEGSLCGDWISLPTDKTSKEIFKDLNINLNTDEYFIADYESEFNFNRDEYANIDELNKLAKIIDSLDEYDLLLFQAYTDYDTCSIQELLEIIDYKHIDIEGYVYYDCRDMSDVAYQLVEECDLLHDVPNNLKYYFDYEMFGRDLAIEGTYIELDNAIVELHLY